MIPTTQNVKSMLETVNRLHTAHESFLESYPEDVKTPEGQRYCINNLIRETMSLLSDLSHRLIVEKDISPDIAQDIYIVIMSNAAELMDKYTGRDIDWYQAAICNMIDEMEGEENEV